MTGWNAKEWELWGWQECWDERNKGCKKWGGSEAAELAHTEATASGTLKHKRASRGVRAALGVGSSNQYCPCQTSISNELALEPCYVYAISQQVYQFCSTFILASLRHTSSEEKEGSYSSCSQPTSSIHLLDIEERSLLLFQLLNRQLCL